MPRDLGGLESARGAVVAALEALELDEEDFRGGGDGAGAGTVAEGLAGRVGAAGVGEFVGEVAGDVSGEGVGR